MGRYRLGDIISMTRKSLSITQEQLCNGICSAETLSRIETGRQNPSKDTYEQLMERMGRVRERSYSMLSISGFKILEKKKLYDDCIVRFDYLGAEKILMELKKIIGNTNMDKQFMICAENLSNYCLNRINSEKFLEGLEKAILLTIPQYSTISLSKWPLNKHEATLLLNISSTYAEMKEYEKTIRILEDTKGAVEQSYMDEQERAIMLATILNNLSKWYGLIGNYDKSIEIAQEGITVCKRFNLGHILPNLLYCFAWNKEQLIDLGVLSPENRRECLSYLRQAYYIASAVQQVNIAQFINDHTKAIYNISFSC
ncbi:MAG TPA: helix-turn-helix transcriptional regulator [Mobilitalea sp.]|nr:helix-turn-helix transcriptional regulator [Mobilitalea sp.]